MMQLDEVLKQVRAQNLHVSNIGENYLKSDRKQIL